MSSLNTREWPKIISGTFDTKNKRIVLEFPENSFNKFDSITWDYRYGEELFIQDVLNVNGSQLLTCVVRSEGDGWDVIHLDKYLPGTSFKTISICVGEYDTMY